MNKKDYNEVMEFLTTNYQKCPYDYPFDISQQPDRFGYFEAIMGSDGKVYEAPNGHTRGLVMMTARDLGISAEEVEQRAVCSSEGYLEWLLEQTQGILIWHRFYEGKPNEIQLQRIEELKNLGHLHRKAFNRQQAYI